ncbi:MAG: glutathione S-transferase N-terminal domain-containing protein [Candidatus Aenigmarchaeota archaeon]|nr:glutathione S-transferase N-terminal domain-containing protein [Candidatus Aenigmarchaeota archaeon]
MDVLIYTTPTCHFCKEAKAFFDENGVKYREINVREDLAAMDTMVKKSGQRGVPVIDVDGEIIVGFDKPALAEALDIEE